MNERNDLDFTCVDPATGEEIWRLDQPALELSLRHKLEAHVEVCHACRLKRELDIRARELVRSGEIVLDEVPAPRLIPSLVPRLAPWVGPRRLGFVASLAVAASLACALFLQPRPAGVDVAFRGADETHFTSPVEGEVVGADACRLSWTEVPGATSYQVRLSEINGSFVWEGSSESPRLNLPGDVSLQDGSSYKALLSVQPADLLPPWSASVVFRAGGPWHVATHRLVWARPWVHGLGLAGLALLGYAGIRRRFA